MNLRYIKLLIIIVFFSFSAQARIENNKVFGDWLVSCKLANATDKKGDCFMGTQYEDEMGGGAIIFTKYYLAFSHNELILTEGVVLKIDNYKSIESSMNTGISSFFKNIDRKALSAQMIKGRTLFIDITNQLNTQISLMGFGEAYNYYLDHINN